MSVASSECIFYKTVNTHAIINGLDTLLAF